MIAGLRRGLAALTAAVLVGALAAAASGTSQAPGISVVEAGGATYPQRTYILSLPSPLSLVPSDVIVTENGARVQGVSLQREGNAGVGAAVVVAIDSSASMAGKPITEALIAARAFAARTGKNEQIAVVTFNKTVNVVQPFTDDKAEIAAALSTTPRLAVGTRIYDALGTSLGLFGAHHVRDASVILLSDGTDVGSTVNRAALLKRLHASHVRVFSVGLVSKTFNRATLSRIAADSRGAFLEATDPNQLTPIYESLGRRLSSEYLLSYKSTTHLGIHVAVRVAVSGVPGAAAVTGYASPPVHIVPAPPYQPSSLDQVVQSEYTMLGIALAFAALVGFAVSHVATARVEPLIDRVGSFVSVTRAGRGSRSRGPSLTKALMERMKEPGPRSERTERLAATLELADIHVEPIQVIMLTIIATVVVALLLVVVVGPIGFLVGLATPLAVRAFVRMKIARRRRAFSDQLPDNLDVLASALRAGHSLVSALSVVAENANEPSKSEFQRVLSEEQFGANLEDAMQVVVVRMESEDLDEVALVARLQREVGSNSAEVLDRVIETVRGRMELRRLVRTLTAQGSLTRWVLTGLPIGLAVVMTLIGGSYMDPLFNETLGNVMLAGAASMVALGSWLIGRVINIKV